MTTLKLNFALFTALVTILFNLTSCSKSADTIAPENVLTTSARAIAIDSNATLKQVAPFPIGVSFFADVTRNSPKNYNTFITQFDAKTVKVFMNTETTPGQFNFKEADYWTKFVQTNPMRLHGHVLLYHEAAPNWLLNFSGSTSEFEQLIKNHIQTIVGRYKGQIKSWDVTNELFDWNGNITPTTFRKRYASDAAYMSFIKRCFQWAHAADPDALLF